MSEPKATTNLNYLKNLHPVKLIRHVGDRKSGELEDHRTVHREERIWMGREYGMVRTADYGNHFIFSDPDFDPKTGEWPRGRQYIGRFTPLCSCGSMAVVVGAAVYREDASPTGNMDSTNPGMMLVCWFHSQYGQHVDGSHD